MKMYVSMGMFDLAIEVYKHMRKLGVYHDCYTLPLVNRAVLMLGSNVLLAKTIHRVGIQTGFLSDLYFCNTLIEVYAKSRYIFLAHRLFDEMSHRDLVSWTSMISGYVEDGNRVYAFDLYNKMATVLEPNSVSMITMLQACSSSESAVQGKQFHGCLLKKGFLNDRPVRNSLLQMYASKGCAKDVEILYSESVRNDIVASNILFSFYNSTGDIEGVVKRFSDMHGKVEPSAETLTLVASTFSKSGNLSQCQQLHCFALKAGFGDHVLLTSLLMTYANCGDLGAATALFSEISLVSSITWSSMISGYVEHGHYEKAIELFKQWQASRIKPGADIKGILVDVSANLGALHLGKEIHGYCVRNLSHYSFKDDFVLETSILNMYARCGSISSARHCFGLMVMRDVIAWTSMIEGLGTYGLGLEALKLFDQMLKEGIRPNSITFVSLLSACSHSGLSNTGCELFYSMKWKFGIAPELFHYTCIVDLLGRSGKLREALAIILKMLACPDGRIWGALLAGSRVHGNRNIGFYAAKKLSELEPDNVGYQIILSNVQASTEQWTKVEAIRQVLRGVHSKKAPGWSCIEVERAIEGFVSGDRSHPLMEEVYEVLGFLSRQMHDSSMCSMDKMII